MFHSRNSLCFNATNSEVGKIVGGTKGNKVLDFISASPAKERALEEAPNMFDYSELTKYGYSVSTRSCTCWSLQLLLMMIFRLLLWMLSLAISLL